MSLHEKWHYDGSDPAIMLFSSALRWWQLPILPGQRVLELGCNESPFLSLLAKADPSLDLVGVDARPSDSHSPGHGPEGWTFVQGSAWDQSLFKPESFDWVLMLGALEHFGLGYYGDPTDGYSQGLEADTPITESGDWRTVEACARWLKPGGGLYFDVPCNPERAQTPHFRTYEAARPLHTLPICEADSWDDDDEAWPLREKARGWSLPEPTAGTWIPQPVIHRVPYHFVAVWAEKA